MKKSKKIICGAVAVAITMSVAFSGCGLLSTINEEDMKQTIATVNIGKSDKLDSELKAYASAIQDEVIVKRDLVSAFVNVGSTYVNSYGMSYEQTFNMLLDELTNNAVVIQYATMYVLKNKVGDNEITLAEYNAKTTMEDKLVYLLGGEDSKGVKQAKYSLYTSLNSALDSYEKSIINGEDEDKYSGTDTRSTPGGIDTTVDDYLPLRDDGTLDYGVYTGYANNENRYLLTDAGKYEPLDNTNRNTRRRAYSRFLTSIRNNYLLAEEDKDMTDILKISYVQDQYVSQLQQSVVNEFNDIYTKEQEEKISAKDDEEVYTFVKNTYDELLVEQSQANKSSSDFESSFGNLSDTSFLLWAPDTTKDTDAAEADGVRGTFGYVYNILLPYSVPQSNMLSKLQGYRDSEIISENQYYVDRNALLKEIKTTDQRAAWFNGQTDYSFDAEEYNADKADGETLGYYNAGNADRKYLFFENNLTKTEEYKPLEKYVGKYSYNGKVVKNKDGSYNLMPNKLTIDDMLAEFSAYINYVLGRDAVEMYAGDTMTGNEYSLYYGQNDFVDEDGKVDYSKLVYATGKVRLTDLSKENMFVATSDRYLAMAAVNELQYAYTTDTGVLSQYIGYTVSAYETNYIKEFEYASQTALRMGVGAFKVCAGDYGWHLIYVTDTFDINGGEVYAPTFTEENITKEGTFENKFFEWIKDKTLSNETTQKRTEILQYFSNDKTVTKYENAYKDLLELDK